MHPVVGQCDCAAEHSASEVDFGFGMGFVTPIWPLGGVKEGFHLVEGVVAIFGLFTDEVGQGSALDALGDGVNESPFAVGVVDVEWVSDG